MVILVVPISIYHQKVIYIVLIKMCCRVLLIVEFVKLASDSQFC